MSEWNDGDRKLVDRDHDLLTKIDANLTNFMKRFDEHATEDRSNFEKHDVRITRLEKYGAMAVGALAILQYILTHLWK